MIEDAGFLLPFASGAEIHHPLGPLGRSEGMAALATACVDRPEK